MWQHAHARADADIAALPSAPPALAERPLLHFITCGSVDDGKSTLLGRLLHDVQAVSDDQQGVLTADSKRFGTTGDAPDFALLLDGLEAEREQGITIDVAYRYFATGRRAFIVADTPGHEQYTRNMVTGASSADLAVILVDASQGVVRQTRRHSAIVRALGVRHVVLAINKMDLVEFAQTRFAALVDEYAALAATIGIEAFTAIPVVARDGDNVVRRSARTPWYAGPTLIATLETAAPPSRASTAPMAMAVQRVSRPDARFRGYAGRIAAGQLRPGQRLRVLPSGASATVARIVAAEGDRAHAAAGESVMLTFAEAIDCARGDVIVAPEAEVGVASALDATLIWLDTAPLDVTRRYLLKLGTRTIRARVAEIGERFDPETGEHHATSKIACNDLARGRIALDRPVAADLYGRSRTLGGFILIDPVTNATVAAGLVTAIHAASGREQRRAQLYRLDAATSAIEPLAARAEALLRAGGAPAAAITSATIERVRTAAVQGQTAVRDVLAELLREAGVAVILADADPSAPGKRLTPDEVEAGLGGGWVI
jgi:bifunctional enzyme CysN/CysC